MPEELPFDLPGLRAVRKDPETGLLYVERPYPLPSLSCEQLEALLTEAEQWHKEIFNLTVPRL